MAKPCCGLVWKVDWVGRWSDLAIFIKGSCGTFYKSKGVLSICWPNSNLSCYTLYTQIPPEVSDKYGISHFMSKLLKNTAGVCNASKKYENKEGMTFVLGVF